jgi:hypothetical protein
MTSVTFKQNWDQRLQGCRTLDTFKHFKTSLGFQNYLLQFNFRSVLSKLILSSHQLIIETDRYARNKEISDIVYFASIEI